MVRLSGLFVYFGERGRFRRTHISCKDKHPIKRTRNHLMKNLKLATIAYVSTFEKYLGQTTRGAYAAREAVADQLVAAAFEAMEETHSVNGSPVDADLIDLTLGAAKEMTDFMTMTGQDGFLRGDLPEDIFADMLAEAREYLYGGLESAISIDDHL